MVKLSDKQNLVTAGYNRRIFRFEKQFYQLTYFHNKQDKKRKSRLPKGRRVLSYGAINYYP